MKKENKKKAIKVMAFLISTFAILLSVSYAFINKRVVGNKQQVIDAGNLELILDEDENNLLIEDAYPIADEVGMIQEAFTFRITNKTSMDTNYILKLEDITIGEVLAKEDVKYSLTKNKEITIDFVSNIVDNVIDEGKIKGNATIEYELRLWLREDLTSDATVKGKSLRFRINLKMSQKEEIVYKESILNGTDPVLSNNLVPVTIQDNGTVQKANIYDEWYSYEDKLWANAVVLLDKTKTYREYEIIPEENIESYFVWIPKYRYQLWDTTAYFDNGTINTTKPRSIPIQFGMENTSDQINGECTTPMTSSNASCKVGDFMTHPAFLDFDSTGFWVGKFESGYKNATTLEEAQVNSGDSTKLQIKPDVYSWRNITVGNAFKVSYDYLRSNESHMMKNTEWGAVAYLQHSKYGSSMSVRNNNNRSYKTGYASVEEPNSAYNNGISIPGNLNGTTPDVTRNYNTETGYLASTTGNITGIYDMSGGSWEVVMGYNIEASTIGGTSQITSIYPDFFSNNNWKKYYNQYSNEIENMAGQYKSGILGDATREMGPFQFVKDPDNSTRRRSSWYYDVASTMYPSHPWQLRGGYWLAGNASGIFAFGTCQGSTDKGISFRVVLAN